MVLKRTRYLLVLAWMVLVKRKILFVLLVHASRTFVIPAQSEICVSAELNSFPRQAGIAGMVLPRSELHHRYSLFGASELVKVAADGSVPVRMVNPSLKPVKIYRRTKLAVFEEVDQNIATFELSATEPDVSTCS